VKIDLPCLQQEQDYSCVPACLRIVLRHLGADFSEMEIGEVSKTTELGTDHDEAAQGILSLGFNVLKLENAKFDNIKSCIRRSRPVVVIVSVKHLPYGGQSGTHAVVVNGFETNLVSFIDPARGEEIEIDLDTFLRAWQARGCLGLVVET